MSATIAIKTVKVTIPVDAELFPWTLVPVPGTPGGKNLIVDIDLDYGDGAGTLRVSLKGGGLQKLLNAHNASPQGGYVVIQGKLANGGKSLLDAGGVYQPKKVAEVGGQEQKQAA